MQPVHASPNEAQCGPPPAPPAPLVVVVDVVDVVVVSVVVVPVPPAPVVHEVVPLVDDVVAPPPAPPVVAAVPVVADELELEVPKRRSSSTLPPHAAMARTGTTRARRGAGARCFTRPR
jgi:hypothetical protein